MIENGTLTGVRTDVCPNLTWINVGLLKWMKDKVSEINPQLKLVFLAFYYTPRGAV